MHERQPTSPQCAARDAAVHLVRYVERADPIDVWRVLHTRRDIPRRLHDGGDPTAR